MSSVPVKSAAQQAGAMLLRVREILAREILVRQRTQLINALRGHASELGLVAPIGNKGLARLRVDVATGATLPAPAANALRLA